MGLHSILQKITRLKRGTNVHFITVSVQDFWEAIYDSAGHVPSFYLPDGREAMRLNGVTVVRSLA